MSGRSMWEAPDGTMFFVNSGSIVMGRPGSFRTASPAQGVPDVSVAVMAKDGTIWLGCANGIYRWAHPFRLEYWAARDGFVGRYRIRRLGDKMFAGNGQEGIAVLRDDRTRWEPLPKSKSLDGDNLMKPWLLAALVGVLVFAGCGVRDRTEGLPQEKLLLDLMKPQSDQLAQLMQKENDLRGLAKKNERIAPGS